MGDGEREGDSTSDGVGAGLSVDFEGVGLDEGWAGICGSLAEEGSVEEDAGVSLAGSREEDEEITGDEEWLGAGGNP